MTFIMNSDNLKYNNFERYVNFASGCFGGLIGTIASHPVDTIKSRCQKGISISKAIQQKNFFSGLNGPVFTVPVEKAIAFGVTRWGEYYNIHPFISGGTGGFISAIIVTPMEYWKTNRQTDKRENVQSLKKLNIFKGFSKAYIGAIPTICRESFGYAIYFSIYSYLSKTYNKTNDMFKTFVFGGMTGFGAWTCIYPIDLVKTIRQDKNNTKG